jgi:hypothetical protein
MQRPRIPSSRPSIRALRQLLMQATEGRVARVGDLSPDELGDPRVADGRLGGNALPVATALFERLADFDIKWDGHGCARAKFCGSYAQHFATAMRKTLRVPRKPIVQVVAECLAWHLDRQGLNPTALSKRAGVSPNTVKNFLRPAAREPSASGKVPSGKLTELEMIATALGLEVADLVTDMSESARAERHRLSLAMRLLRGDQDATSGESSDSTPTTGLPNRQAA